MSDEPVQDAARTVMSVEHAAGAVAARAHAVVDAQRASAILGDVIGAMSDAFFAYDTQWRCVWLNEPARRLLAEAGIDVDGLARRSIWEAIPALEGGVFQQHMLRCARDRVMTRFEAPGPISGRWVETTAIPVPGGVAAFARETGDRQRAAVRERLLVDAGALLGRSRSLHDTLRGVASLATRSFCDACSARLEADPNAGDAALVVSEPDGPPAPDALRMLPLRPSPPDASVADRVLRTGRAVLVHAGALVVPLTARERTIGTATFLRDVDRRRDAFDADDVRTAEELGRLTALAIDNMRLLAAERAARTRAERLQDLATALSAARSFSDVAEAVLTEGMALVGASGGRVIAPPEPGDRLLRVVNGRGWSETEQGPLEPIPVDARVPSAEAVATGRIVWVREHEMPERYPDHAPVAKRGGHRTWIAVPFLHDGRVLGAFGLALPDDRPASEDILALLRTMAHQCAQAMERIRLFQAAMRLLEAERDARREAESARAAAESANRAKSDFLAIMSHELRTPLNAISGYVELLELGIRGPVTDDQVAALRRIRAAQRTLLRRIDDVLSFAKLEAGQVRYDIGEVSVAQLIAEVEPFVMPQVMERRIAFRSEPCDPSLIAWADGEKANQVLLNLVTNALKFTPEGGAVTVAAALVAGEVIISVSDTGVGIAAEKVDTIFDPFVQVDTRLTREHEGTGLGLAISRDLMVGMGGDLTVESAPGSGSTFRMILPSA